MNKWVCEIWWQNKNGEEVTTCKLFATQAEAEAYGFSKMGTFNGHGRLAVYFRAY